MDAEHLNRLCDSLLGMLIDGPRENSRLGTHAATLLEELVVTNWGAPANTAGVRVNAQLVNTAQTAMDGFERWFGPQPLASEDPDQYRAAPDVEQEIRGAIGFIRGIVLEQLPGDRSQAPPA